MRISNLLSYINGQLASLYIPKTLRKPIFLAFSGFYGVNLSEIGDEISSFRSFKDFFTRSLKAGSRKVSFGFVSPADSLFIDGGEIDNQRMIGVKGCSYNVPELLGDEHVSSEFIDGSFFNFYLAPGDYHHVHSPVSGKIVHRVYIPGSLYPVSKLFVSLFSDLYVRQERVVTIIEDDEDRLFAIVMVGAFNVGSMGLAYEGDFLSNKMGSGRAIDSRKIVPPIEISKGDKIGTFYLGSTVVLLSSVRLDFNELKIEIGNSVKFGNTVIDL